MIRQLAPSLNSTTTYHFDREGDSMTQKTTFDRAEGKRRKTDGVNRALSAQEIWRDGYSATVQFWFDRLPIHTRFTGEQVRVYCLGVGRVSPRHHNSWSGMAGRMLRRWLDARLIEHCGMDTATSKTAHYRAYPRYRKIVIAGQRS